MISSWFEKLESTIAEGSPVSLHDLAGYGLTSGPQQGGRSGENCEGIQSKQLRTHGRPLQASHMYKKICILEPYATYWI